MNGDYELDEECADCGTRLIMTMPEETKVCPVCLARV